MVTVEYLPCKVYRVKRLYGDDRYRYYPSGRRISVANLSPMTKVILSTAI